MTHHANLRDWLRHERDYYHWWLRELAVREQPTEGARTCLWAILRTSPSTLADGLRLLDLKLPRLAQVVKEQGDE